MPDHTARETHHLVHHLVPAPEWAASDPDAPYRPASLAAEGFIHFSTTAQVAATSLRYYRDVADLLLVSVDVDRLCVDGGAELRWEDLAGTGVFPHLYGPLTRDAVVGVQPYTAGAGVTMPT